MRIKLLISCFIVLISCNGKPKNTEQKIEENVDIEAMFLELKSEQIHLLSIINDIPYEKAFSVLKDYEIKTDTLILMDEIEESYFNKMIDTIAQKHKLNNKEVAKLIYSFKYSTDE